MMKRLFVDLSLTAQTQAGSAIYAWEVCHRLMRLAHPLQVLPMTSPFRTHARSGFSRNLQALLRDLLWRPFLAGLEAREKDCFLFTNTFVPRRFLHREYAVILLDLGAWHDRNILSWRGRLGLLRMPRVLGNARHIFAISEYTAQDASGTFSIPRDRITLAPCGLSSNFTDQGREIGSINGISMPKRYLLHVGSLEPKKNIPFLLQVYALFRESDPDRADTATEPCKLVLTGAESWQDETLRQAIAAHPFARDILLLGPVPAQELPGLYRQTAALVFPSTFEGFGLPVIEALSQGTPVLVQDNSSLAQFRSFGATVLDTFDTRLWVDHLQDILCHQTRLTHAHVQTVRDHFDWDKTAMIIWRTMLGS